MRLLLSAAAVLLAALPAWPTAAHAAQVTVAVASSFAAPMQQIAAAFERQTGHKALLAIGSTGRFHAQIRQGAPFQLLLAADAATPAQLEREGLAVPGSRFTYAIGRLVLWSAQPARVDPQGQALRQPGSDRLAIADPRLAPYGAAAIEALQALGVLPAWRARLVQGDSVGQAFQFVASGNAAMGLVALAQVKALPPGQAGSAWLVPEQLHAPLRQDAVLLLPGKEAPAAQALARFLREPQAQGIIRAHGYQP